MKAATAFLAAVLVALPAAQSEPVSAAGLLNRMWSAGKATGNGPVRLKNFPLRLNDIGTIIPMGLTASGHVTPSDHLYLVTKTVDQRCDVLAMADGYIVNIQWRPKGNPDPAVFDREVDLKVIIEHSATCWSYVDHLDGLTDELRTRVGDTLKPGQPIQVRIPVKAGQVIGQVHGRTFDFAMVDTTVTRTGFVRPEQFLERDPWKLHTVDPFDYADEPLRSQLLALNPRQTRPLGGRMDYDVDGRLVGNWYRQNSGGYAGLNRRLDYWYGHLAFVYHHVEPGKVVVSLGNYQGQPRQFWVKGNGPDPAQVSATDGLIKYELLWGQLGTAGQLQRRHDADVVQAVALAQLVSNRALKLEVFPGKTAAEVTGFTGAAQLFER